MLRRRMSIGTTTHGGVAATWVVHGVLRSSSDAVCTTRVLQQAECHNRMVVHSYSQIGMFPLYASSRWHSTTAPLLNAVAARTLPSSPYQCSIEHVLLPDVGTGGSGIRTETLRGMVQLLLDPDATDVEDVSMLDFVVMVPRRQVAALRGRKDWLEVVLSSERFQACKDARALRLAGITTVGRWDENRERVPVSAYSRGILEEAYSLMARQPMESQKDQVITWLTKTIQKAVIEEFAANKSNRKFLAPLITGMQALPESSTTAAAAAAAAAAAEVEAEEAEVPVEGAGAGVEEEESVGCGDSHDDTSEKALIVKAGRPPKGRGKKGAKRAEAVEEDEVSVTAGGSASVSEDTKKGEKIAAPEEDEDAEIARLLKETEQEFAPAPYVRGSGSGNKDAAANVTAARIDGGDNVKHAKTKKNKKKGADDETEQQQQQAKGASDAVHTVSAPSEAKQDNSLARLAELMLNQFNSADGYLHLSDTRDDEKKGFIITIDGEVAQVDPFALYSAFSAVKAAGGDSPEIAALKQVWSTYNSYTEARDAADDDVMMRFYREKGVEVLVHASVLLRAISRGHTITLDQQEIPVYGFPLLSSDRRPYRTRRGKGATDMTAEKVTDAVREFTAFFANKSTKFTPIRPVIDCNSGCSVAALMGTTLHLYETSLKEAVREEDIRCRFAEAMLGVLHVLEKRVIMRVNVVHYHILATSISGGGHGGMDNMPTSIVSIDTSGPFTTIEKTRLQQLAEPLGMVSVVADCACVSDLVDVIEGYGVSVVHDILTSRDDLEALLTPTLVQLLPEVEEEDSVETKPSVRRSASTAVAKTPPPQDEKEDDDDEEEEGEEEDEEDDNVEEGGDDDDEEEEEEEEEVEEVVVQRGKVVPTKAGRPYGATVKTVPASSAASDDDGGYDEDDEDENVGARAAAVSEGGKRMVMPVKGRQARGRPHADEEIRAEAEGEGRQPQARGSLSKKGACSSKRAAPPPAAVEHDNDDYDDDDDDGYDEDDARGEVQKPLAAPPPTPAAAAVRKGHVGRRAPLSTSSSSSPPPLPPSPSVEVGDEECGEMTMRRTLRKSAGARRTPPPPPVTAVAEAVDADDGNDGEETVQEEIIMAPRARSRSSRRMSRAPMPREDMEADDDRWFQKARR